MRLRIKDTWIYREGGIENLQEAAIELCTERFGKTPDEPSLQQIRRVREPSLLRRLIVRLSTASSLLEALSALPAT